MVDAFHKAAVDAGGKCNGPPGLRPQYHANYYGAFVLDPIGNNIEAVGSHLVLKKRGGGWRMEIDSTVVQVDHGAFIAK